MNNTFVLAIFMMLIFFKELTWSYFAETVSILFVLFCVGLMALKKVHTVLDGYLILFFCYFFASHVRQRSIFHQFIFCTFSFPFPLHKGPA